MQRSSQHTTDEVAWEVVGLRPGAVGLDTRSDGVAGSLKELRNARFVDVADLARRDGFVGEVVQDGEVFPSSSTGSSPVRIAGDWVYGHGVALDTSGYSLVALEPNHDAHVPIAGRCGGVFRFNGADVVWTGDRLLVSRQGDTDIGYSTHWTGTSAPQGIPAMLPVQTNSSPPEPATAVYSSTCLTGTLRVIATATASQLIAWVIDRASGAVLDRSVIASALAKDAQVINSGDTPVLVWREGTELRLSYWTGVSWSSPAGIFDPVTSFSVAVTPTGFHLAYISGGSIVLSEYQGRFASAINYTPLSVVTPSVAPVQHLAIAVNPDNKLYAAYMSVGTGGQTNDLRCAVITNGTLTREHSVSLGTAFDAVTITSRTLRRDPTTDHPAVVYGAIADQVKVCSYEVYPGFAGVLNNWTRFNSKLASHAFIVGNEPVVWLRTTLASVHYLMAGVVSPEIIAYADREEAAARDINDEEQGLQRVLSDPTRDYWFTWVSLWNPGTASVGNVRVGDINFLPPLVTAQYGASVYLAGSAVRNWDGMSLGDAGFQDYPIVDNSSLHSTSGGSLTPGVYSYRVYAVRYNAQGERFQSAALTSALITVVGASQKVFFNFTTYPSANSTLVFEIYRTEADGSTYYLESTVPNDLTVASITYNSTLSDADLITKAADPHAPGVGIAGELESFGPIGCSVLATAADRLWGAGGQVPAGTIQFSKLKEAGEGAGFDDLGGTLALDLNGNEITSIAPIASGVAVFLRNQLYILNGDGPDNLGSGSFGIPELRLVDGATTHLGTTTIQAGVLYWGQDGPRLLDLSLRTQNIALPVHSLTSLMDPTGVQVDLGKQEVTWFSSTGEAIHVNYQNDAPRWAEWVTPPIAGCSQYALVTPGGRILRREDGADDDGAPFAFSGSTNDIKGDDTSGESTLINTIGVTGDYLGPHTLRIRVSYNRSPSWLDEWVWQPSINTWLASGDTMSTLTPAQIDALTTVDRSGGYATHRRASVPQCRTFRVEWSDISSHTPTLTLQEIQYEVGSRPGPGRVAVNKFGG